MSRIKNSQKNISVSLIFFLTTLLLSFVSRKIILDAFGAELLGLTSTMSNIIGFLNLIELGVGTAIGTCLYKPVFDDNKKEINNIISIFGYFYHKTGLLVLALGSVLLFFLPLIFKDKGVDMIYIYVVYITYLISSLIPYFISYKHVILDLYQKGYIVAVIKNLALIIKITLQIVIIKYFTESYFLWLALELLYSFIYVYLINKQVIKHYSWLKTSIRYGKENSKNYPEIIKKIKEIIPHKLSTFILFQTDSVLIFVFTSLKTVTLFTNYQMIISKTVTVISIAMSGMYSIVGNLIASNDQIKIRKVYSIMQILFFSFATILIIPCYFLVDPFISVWLGDNYVLDNTVLFFMLINSYLAIIRIPTDIFKMGYAIFYDTWAPYTEAFINLGLSLILGYFYGLIGVLLGTFISVFLIVFLWKPIILYRDGFKESVCTYWIKVLKYLTIAVITFISVNLFINNIYNPDVKTFIEWIIYTSVVFCVTLLTVLILTFIMCKEFKTVLYFIRNRQIL